MKKKSTFYPTIFIKIGLVTVFTLINSFASNIYGQTCSNAVVIHSEDFGTGVTPVSNPDVSSLVFVSSGSLTQGEYRIVDNTQQTPGWQSSADHTGNANGRMLVAEGMGVVIYQIFINRETGFYPGDYNASLAAMNLDPIGFCGIGVAKLPVMVMEVDYLAQDGQYIPLTGAPYIAPALIQTNAPLWVNIDTSFNLPSTGSFLVKNLRFFVADMTFGGVGCGNDFAVDDIVLSQCASAGNTPVTFLNVTAHQKGSGVIIDWSTAQEFNNKFFVIEKSADGNSGWSAVSSINGAGNSSTLKSYEAYDAKPFNGMNYYRIKQVDADGHFTYSKIVNTRLVSGTQVSVSANPFHNSISVNISSIASQNVTVKLTDATGKEIAAGKWSISSGNTRKDMTDLNRLQNGIYILTISGANGGILYNNKIVKQ